MDGVRQVVSPATPSGSRLVVTTCSCGHSSVQVVQQLRDRTERDARSCPPPRAPSVAEVAREESITTWWAPQLRRPPRAIAGATRVGIDTGASSTQATPSLNSSTEARRDLLLRGASCRTPPAPVTVTNRRVEHEGAAAPRALPPRPTSGVEGAGRLWRKASSDRSDVELGPEIRVGQLPHTFRTCEVAKAVPPEVAQGRRRRAADRRPARRRRRTAGPGHRARRPAIGTPDHRVADVVVAATHLRFARVQRHADPQVLVSAHVSEPLARQVPPRTASEARAKAATMLSPSPCSCGRTPP